MICAQAVFHNNSYHAKPGYESSVDPDQLASDLDLQCSVCLLTHVSNWNSSVSNNHAYIVCRHI